VRAFLVVLIGALLLGGCAAKQTAVSAHPPSETGTIAMAPPVSPNDAARDNYDRAVAAYQDCVLDNTINLSVCERQRTAMNAAANVLFGPPSKRNTIINVE
jgi:hypothetical protein